MMNKITSVKSVDELIKIWPRLVKLAKQELPDVEPDNLLQLFLACLQRGVVVLARTDKGLVGFACLEIKDGFGQLYCIPADEGVGLGKSCKEFLVAWAKEQNLDGIKATTNRLCGASFRYFEKSLGFRRNSVTFLLKV